MIGKKIKEKKKKEYSAYVSKHNSNCEKQVTLFMIPNGEKWHYLAVKELSALLRGIISKHYDGFYYWNCFHSLRTKNKFELHKRVCENKGLCKIIIPSEDTKILELNQYQKSDKAPFIIYADLECLIEKIGCKNNPETSFTTKLGEHNPSSFLMSTI